MKKWPCPKNWWARFGQNRFLPYKEMWLMSRQKKASTVFRQQLMDNLSLNLHSFKLNFSVKTIFGICKFIVNNEDGEFKSIHFDFAFWLEPTFATRLAVLEQWIIHGFQLFKFFIVFSFASYVMRASF